MFASAVWIGPAIFAAINEMAQRRLHGERAATVPELLWSGGDWLVYAILTPAVFWASNRWPIARPHPARRATLHVGLAVVFCAGWAFSGKLLQFGLALAFRPQEVQKQVAAAGTHLYRVFGLDLLSWIFTTLPFGLVVYFSLAGIAHAIRYFVEARDREVQLARLSEQLAGARFAALQAQLNPHFLFNTLNTIAVRARDGDGAGTARMVEQLSEVLRRTLGRHRASEVTLGEELELVRQYLAIEQARFSDRLRPVIDVEDALLAAAVPGFALQHLVENAIRHGIARRSGAGAVRVAARRDRETLVLSVTDDGPGIDPRVAPPKGHGIENARERLRALYGDRASLSVEAAAGGGTTATLRLPYREIAMEAKSGDSDS